MRPAALVASFLSLLLLASGAGRAGAADAPPVAPVRDVADTLWGVVVHDPYRYMENLKDPEVRAWIDAQADYTRERLDAIPGRDSLLQRIEQLDAGRPYRIFAIDRRPDGSLYYQRVNADQNIPKLYRRPSLGGEEQLLVDPAKNTPPDGGHYSLSFYVPSPDGRRVLYGLAPSGSEQDVLHVLDVASGTDLPDEIDRMEDGYTAPQWLPDGSGFFYSRRRDLPPDAPATEGYKLTRAYFHRLGTDPAHDPLVFAKDLWPNAPMSDVDFPSIVLSQGSPYAIGKIKHGDATQITLYAARLGPGGDLEKRKGGASPWKQVCDVGDSVTAFAVHGDDVYLLTARKAPHFRLVRERLASPGFAHAEVVVPQGDRVLGSVAATHDALYLDSRNGAATGVERVAYAAGAKAVPLALPDDYPSGAIVSAGPQVTGILVGTSAWTRGGRIYAYDPEHDAFSDTHLAPRGRYDDEPGYTSTEVWVTARDGVKVPLSIVYRKGLALDGSHPTLLNGYGSYGLSRNVRFEPMLLAWLERGGVFAVAHVRGGGELGEEWRLAGRKLQKHHTWEDFIDCAQYLVDHGYTSPAKLAGEGGSAGGILIGRAVTDRPDLFDAALFDVGALDAIRMENTMNGVPNIPEFGTVKTEAGFKGLLQMSTYAHVKPGVRYPAVMLSVGLNDPRVEPWESAKTCARMQAATTSGKPVLLRVETHAGHGIGSTKHQREIGFADRLAFLLWQMGETGPLP